MYKELLSAEYLTGPLPQEEPSRGLEKLLPRVQLHKKIRTADGGIAVIPDKATLPHGADILREFEEGEVVENNIPLDDHLRSAGRRWKSLYHVHPDEDTAVITMPDGMPVRFFTY